MSEPLPAGKYGTSTPRFYVTPRQRFSPWSFLLAFLITCGCFLAIRYLLARARHAQASLFASGSADDNDDDPSQMDTIYLGGPDEAPTPARKGGRPSTVHPFVVVQLPRSGKDIGQIPDSAAGRLLYQWLARFNSKDIQQAATALQTPEPGQTAPAQLALRKETGGFSLISAREIQPGLIVFRLQDQTVAAREALGTLQTSPGVTPASIASFSLRDIPPSPAKPQ